ncbi:hypothetical protein [Sunxiuqinia indica]|uniref:hypothetical protein n=1 Tax=Sunxiuqinia indica TaxID=2692584 RepID=UPI0013582D38|nr:hypothetical protein [Sunxiuqinia indica]
MESLKTTADYLAEALRPVIREEVEKAIPDRLITSLEAIKILEQDKHFIMRQLKSGKLKNYGDGKHRPKLSYHEVHQLKKDLAAKATK